MQVIVLGATTLGVTILGEDLITVVTTEVAGTTIVQEAGVETTAGVEITAGVETTLGVAITVLETETAAIIPHGLDIMVQELEEALAVVRREEQADLDL